MHHILMHHYVMHQYMMHQYVMNNSRRLFCFHLNVNVSCRVNAGDHCGGRRCGRWTHYHRYHHLCHRPRRHQVTSIMLVVIDSLSV